MSGEMGELGNGAGGAGEAGCRSANASGGCGSGVNRGDGMGGTDWAGKAGDAGGAGAEKPRLAKKIVIVVNGSGGAGKDTVCEIASRHFRARTVSAIAPVKELAARCGWDGGKDNKSRKFLSDLKRALIEYNDLPNRYLEGEHAAFMAGGDDVLFAHIREGAQIDDFRRRVAPTRCVALLVRPPSGRGAGGQQYGNDSDDNVEDYAYDYYYDNDKPIACVESDFMRFFRSLLRNEGLLEF
ncbi:MAG: hypothetical protein LBL83_00100 [Clostridiales bacterium]|jgi:hypothetical protein|nr:hypothetical protein [Clostridiales bacterium]